MPEDDESIEDVIQETVDGVVPEDAPAKGVVDPSDPDPPEPAEPG